MSVDPPPRPRVKPEDFERDPGPDPEAYGGDPDLLPDHEKSTPATRDERLEIPEVLRRPVERPASMKAAPMQGSTNADNVEMAKGWAIAMNFVYGLVGMGLVGWLIQHFWLKNAAPWPLLIGLGVGLIGGFSRFIIEALAANRRASLK